MAKYKIIPSSRTIVQSPISIGHKAEKGVEAIEFDLTAWVETYGSGTLTVIMRRWGDAIPYPIALEIGEDNKATWTLSDIDTAKAGMAYAQLSYIVGETVVKKSDIYTFRVMDSLTGEGDPPEAYESWLEHLTHLAAEAMAEVLDIESIVTDKTLTVDGGIADAKATGEALAEKVDAADYNELSTRVGANTIALAEKADRSTTYTKTEVDQMIEDVEVETDTTLAVSGAPADSKKVGDELTAIKADLDSLGGDLLTEYSDPSMWERKSMTAKGVISDSTTRLKSIEAVTEDVLTVKAATGYQLAIYGWDGDTCMGYWSTQSFVKTSGTLWHTGEMDLTVIRAKQPTYSLFVAVAKSDITQTITLEESENITYEGSRVQKVERELRSVPKIDRTLAIDGYAAESSETGRILDNHKYAYEHAMTPMDKPDDGYWQVGGYMSLVNFNPSLTQRYAYRGMKTPLTEDVYLYVPDLNYGIAGYTYTENEQGTKTQTGHTTTTRCWRIPAGQLFTIVVVHMIDASEDTEILADETFAKKVFMCGCNSDFFRLKSEFCSATLFDKIAIIGDSYGAGAGAAPNIGGTFSWGKTMGRLINSQVDLFCQSGQGTAEWIPNSSKGLAALLNTDRYGLYWYGLGINDANKTADASQCGTVADLTTYADIDYTTEDGTEKTACLSTLYGRIGYIIRSIQKYAPKSKIVIATVLGTYGASEVRYADYRLMNNVLTDVAEFYSLPLMDLRTDVFYNTEYARYSYSGQAVANHPLAITYTGMAKANLRLLQNAMWDYIEYFRDYNGVYTD